MFSAVFDSPHLRGRQYLIGFQGKHFFIVAGKFSIGRPDRNPQLDLLVKIKQPAGSSNLQGGVFVEIPSPVGDGRHFRHHKAAAFYGESDIFIGVDSCYLWLR